MCPRPRAGADGSSSGRRVDCQAISRHCSPLKEVKAYGQPISHNLWANVVRLIDWVSRRWREADEASGRCGTDARSLDRRLSAAGHAS